MLYLSFNLVYMFYTVIKSKKTHKMPSDGMYRIYAVYDADTVAIKYNNVIVKVRLLGIDAPELSQPFGNVAKKFLQGLILNKNVYVRTSGKGRYGRVIADLYLDNVNVGYTLLRSGMAWVYPQYCPLPRLHAWLNAHEYAKECKHGLWSSKQPIAPFLFRRFKKSLY